MNILVVCEKNDVAKRISRILSANSFTFTYINRVPVYTFNRDGHRYYVIGLRGHIVFLDYPKEYNRWTRTSPEELIDIKTEKRVGDRRIVGALRALAKNTEEVIIATDYDREGELIGVEALDILLETNHNLRAKRAKFSAITPRDVHEAFSNLTDIDYNLASSAETRQIIDLSWGASLTRFLSLSSNKLGRDFLSAGRVQSPALALIVEREEEIRSFVPEPYWEIFAYLQKERVFKAKHIAGKIFDATRAKEIFEKVKGQQEALVVKYEKKRVKERPPVPYNTTLFLADASRIGVSVNRAMSLAEELYNAGWISYPRTDNTVYPRTLNLREVLNSLLSSPFREEAKTLLSQQKMRATRGKSESTDHPPIHPVRGAKRGAFKGDKWKVYELIVRRFLATVAPDAEYEQAKSEFSINGENFHAEGKRLVAEGWRRYFPYYKKSEVQMPDLREGERIEVTKVERVEDTTKPPPRYSEATLLQEMERLGLGTKSTRHEIIQKLYERGYITQGMVPTEAGRAVIDALKNYAPRVTQPEMTSTLERDMDQIALGRVEKEEVINASKEMLRGVLRTLKENEDLVGTSIKEALKKQDALATCPKCSHPLIVRRSRKGKRFLGCTNYPECDVTFPLPQYGKLVATGEVCKYCGSPIIKVIMRRKKPKKTCINLECPGKKE